MGKIVTNIGKLIKASAHSFGEMKDVQERFIICHSSWILTANRKHKFMEELKAHRVLRGVIELYRPENRQIYSLGFFARESVTGCNFLTITCVFDGVTLAELCP